MAKESMKNIFNALLLFLIGSSAFAQIEMSSYTATGRAGVSVTLLGDYQCQGINPANLAFKPEFKKRNICIGFGEFGFSLYSDALNLSGLYDGLFNPNRKLSRAEKQQAAKDFATKALTANMDFLYGGVSWQSDNGLFGLAFTIRERAQWYSKFSPLASEVMFKGFNAQYQNPAGQLENLFNLVKDTIKNINNVPILDENGNIQIDTVGLLNQAGNVFSISRILEGSRISMLWNREFALDYGMNIIDQEDFQLNAGVGIRYIQGIGFLDVSASDRTLNASIAASPAFGLQFPQQVVTPQNKGFFPNPVGQGVGFEFGLSMELRKRWRIGASLTDIGSISYQSNSYTADDSPLRSLSTRGFTNFNFFQDPKQFESFNLELVKWNGKKEMTQSLPSKFRIGASLTTKLLNLGMEIVAPLNTNPGNLVRPVASIGGDIKLLGIIQLSSGFMIGGNYTYGLVPLGITIRPLGPYYEFGVATRDIFTYLRPKNPMLSISFGFCRIRI